MNHADTPVVGLDWRCCNSLVLLQPRTSRLAIMRGDSLRSTDGRLVYVHDQLVPKADPRSFRYAGYKYFKDKRHVYVREREGLRKLTRYHAPSFKVYGGYYTADKSGVYWNHFWMPTADPRTFHITSLHRARDKHRTYLKGVSVNP